MYKVINKSRQVLPVVIKSEGKYRIIYLSFFGKNAECISEENTSNMMRFFGKNLIDVKEGKPKSSGGGDSKGKDKDDKK